MRIALVSLALVLVSSAFAKSTPRSTCLAASGSEATACLESYLGGSSADPAFTDAAVRDNCSDETIYALGGLGVDNLVLVLRNACVDFGHELLIAGTPTQSAASLAATRQTDARRRKCNALVPKLLGTIRKRTIALLGPQCAVRAAKGQRCHRARQDAKAIAVANKVAKRMTKACRSDYASLGLPPIDELVATYHDRVRHFAQLVYPPNDLGPSADPGPFPVGVRTLEFVDQARMNVQATGPRPVTVEIWYPSTSEAVTGVERYVANLFGFDVARTPTYRDVGRANGPFPIVIFSHGNAGIRFQSIFLASHLASHGYIVVSPDHHGNTFLDIGAGIVDAQSAVNRPLDMRFVLDEMLAHNATPDDFFRGAIDPARIGMSGHSFGGYTTFALAAGTYADTRIGAFLPLAPAVLFDDAFFQSITAPILIQGGSLDVTTPFDSQQLAPYEQLMSGANVVGLAEILGAGHFSFSDVCEVPRELVGFIGGFSEACIPEDLPWRHAHDLIDYLALNFFDATLNGDADALARLDPAAVTALGDIAYQRK
jgi:predicted dienelactone hydrolase